MTRQRHAIVIGAGIIGLASGHELASRGYRVTVIEKEERVAAHQTGRNSGVVHSGLYYAPGSLKARLGAAGSASMVAFAREHGVTVDVCGKLVVATTSRQLPALEELHRRGIANGVPCRRVTVDEARAEWEPQVQCVGALRVESTAVVDYAGVCRVLADQIRSGGGEVLLGHRLEAIDVNADRVSVRTSRGTVDGDVVVNCAGLHSDRIARMAGIDPGLRIIGFRGEYMELRPQAAHLVHGLIYPVPDPELPFLGVHLTRMFDGAVHAGPNAVLALAREGYRWRDISVRDLIDVARWPGTWRLARTWWRTGIDEVLRSVSRRRFVRDLRQLVPAIECDDVVPSGSGVRAQAVDRQGKLVDDFVLRAGPRQLHVLNAPSPAATAALEIGRRIADELTQTT